MNITEYDTRVDVLVLCSSRRLSWSALGSHLQPLGPASLPAADPAGAVGAATKRLQLCLGSAGRCSEEGNDSDRIY